MQCLDLTLDLITRFQHNCSVWITWLGMHVLTVSDNSTVKRNSAAFGSPDWACCVTVNYIKICSYQLSVLPLTNSHLSWQVNFL